MSDTIQMNGRIVHVVDADTVHFLSESGDRHKSRLDGINAPECHKKRIKTLDGKISSACISDDEPGGYSAYLFLKNLIEGKNVKFICSGNKNTKNCIEDTYGRVLSTIYLNEVNINNKIVAEGHALSFTKYPSKMRWKYCISESEAREKGNGFWGKSGKDIINRFSKKTRQWYKKHNLLCNQAIKEKNGL
ncbi:thermonuclease family protein [Myxococcota bacterium]|nr:thermonuclease family protein [Myxococcota bacterium]